MTDPDDWPEEHLPDPMIITCQGPPRCDGPPPDISAAELSRFMDQCQFCSREIVHDSTSSTFIRPGNA
jgi:hypothetical protein